jgi:hypothetical protein
VKKAGEEKQRWMFLKREAWERVQQERKRMCELETLYEY